MLADGSSFSKADVAAASRESKPRQLWRHALENHRTATSLPDWQPGQLAGHADSDSECDFQDEQDGGLGSTCDNKELFQERPRLEYLFDKDMAFRPDLYDDAFKVAPDDFLLYDTDAHELPEEDAAALELDELETQANDEVHQVSAMTLPDAFESSTAEDASLLMVPKAPAGTAPQGFARKHQNVLVVRSQASEEAKEQEASEASASEHKFAKVPQGSALAAIAALRPGLPERKQSVVPVAPAKQPPKEPAGQ